MTSNKKTVINKKKITISKVIIFIILTLLLLSFIYPIYYMGINSVKSRSEYFNSPFSITSEPTLENYEVMISQFDIFRLFRNTFVVTGASLALILVFSIFASYAFAKIKFRGRRFTYLLIISTMVIPCQITIIPLYVMFAKMGLINNLWSVILYYIASFLPTTIMLMVSNIRGIPKEVIESAKLDGCGYIRTVLKIIVPLSAPVIALTIIFNFVSFWNDLFAPMILLQNSDVRTVMAALSSLSTRYASDPPYQFAGLILAAMPAIIIYVVFQKFIVKGVTMGSIK